jgi:hypothetical protein
MGTNQLGTNQLDQLGNNCVGPNVWGPYVFETNCVTASDMNMKITTGRYISFLE